MPENITETIKYNNGAPKFDPAAGTHALNPDDTITIEITGFPEKSRILEVDFYHNKTVNGVDQKDHTRSAGSWTASSGSSGVLKAYSVTANSATQIVITDIEHPQNEDKYWYSVEGIRPPDTTTWRVDPELINKSG